MAALDSKPQQIVIAIPIFDNMTALDAIGPYESLTRLPNVVVRFVSHKVGLVTADSGTLSLQATHSFDDLPRPDIIIVPGGNGASTLAAAGDRPILDWIIKAHETTLFTTSVCTGAMLLGAAGLLKGLEATTHWATYEELASYGAIISRQRVVFQGKIITAAGVSSGIDFGITLAAILTDEETAKAAQLSIEYDPEPPYDVGTPEKAGKVVADLAVQLYTDLLNRPKA